MNGSKQISELVTDLEKKLTERPAQRSISTPANTSVTELKSELAALLGTRAMRGGNSLDAKTILRIYADDLADLPGDLVIWALRGFRRGKHGDGHWAPTSAEIRKVVETEVEARARVEKAKADLEAQFVARGTFLSNCSPSQRAEYESAFKRDREISQHLENIRERDNAKRN